jgi:hypothetical protein
MGIELIMEGDSAGWSPSLDMPGLTRDAGRFITRRIQPGVQAFRQQLALAQTPAPGAPPPPPPSIPVILSPANEPGLFNPLWAQVLAVKAKGGRTAVLANNLREMARAIESGMTPTFRATRSDYFYPRLHF